MFRFALSINQPTLTPTTDFLGALGGVFVERALPKDWPVWQELKRVAVVIASHIDTVQIRSEGEGRYEEFESEA